LRKAVVDTLLKSMQCKRGDVAGFKTKRFHAFIITFELDPTAVRRAR
jgi:hypothetical protein